jgi:hypothetical protein
VLWIFAESGGALTVIAAGIFAGLAILSLGLERILKMLEEIRDRAPAPLMPVAREVERVEVRDTPHVPTTPVPA